MSSKPFSLPNEYIPSSFFFLSTLFWPANQPNLLNVAGNPLFVDALTWFVYCWPIALVKNEFRRTFSVLNHFTSDEF
jgi:hypothetical protein